MIFAKDMQVVVLLGGLGTRLRDAAPDVPKPMADIYGKPFFYYQLQLLKWYGFKDFVFCIGYRGSEIESYFKDGSGFDVNIRYSYDGDRLLGTGGAVGKASPLLGDDFMVIYGDSYMDIDYQEIIYYYFKIKTSENKSGLMTVFKNRNRFDKSNVVFKNNELIKYDKKNTLLEMEYIDYGVSVLNRKVIQEIPQEQYTDLADIFAGLVNKGMMPGYEVRNRFYEIGTPSSLNEFKNYIHERLFTSRPAVFLDRDGTINEIVYNEDVEQLDSPLQPEQLKLLPGVTDALNILKSLGYLLIVVTNQPAAAKGRTSLGKLYEINNRLRDILAGNGVYLDDILMCAHYPECTRYCREDFLVKDCECRKPKPGLLIKAMEKFNIDIDRSYMAGDSHVDVSAGLAANVKSVFLGKYKCDACRLLGENKPDFVFENLYGFARYLKNKGEGTA